MTNDRGRRRWIFEGLAFSSGVALSIVAIEAIGVLAAATVPAVWFAAFGGAKWLAIVIEEAFLVAVPLGLLAFGWGWVTLRGSGVFGATGSTGRTMTWCVAGFAAGWIGEVAWFTASSPWPTDGVSFAARLWWSLVPSVYGIATTVAVPIGLLLAAAATRRPKRPGGIEPMRPQPVGRRRLLS